MAYIDFVKKEDPRFQQYEKNKKLYKGLHYEVFNINQFEYYTDPVNQYIVYNYAEVMTNAFNNLIWSETPEIEFENKANQEYFENYVNHDGFFLKMRQISETNSHSGDAVAKVMIDESEPGEFSPVVTQPDNSMWFPIYDENSPSRPAKGHILYIERDIDNSSDKAILLEVHTAGMIEWEAFIKKAKDEYVQVSPMQYFADIMENVLVDTMAVRDGRFIYQTGCKYPLVFHFPNYKITGEFFGVSDYTVPVIAKMYNLNQNYNQIQYVLRKHAHPKMVVPKNVITQAIQQITGDSQSGLDIGLDDFNFTSASQAKQAYNNDRNLFETLVAQKLIDKLEFFGSEINSSDPKYLTWDGNLQESREQISNLKKALFDETQLAKILIDPDVSTGNLSGVAILRLAQPSLHKAQKKIAYIKDSMGRLIYTILDLAKNSNVEGTEGLIPEIPSIKFKDGLVNDLKEEIENQAAMLDSSLTTKVDAIAHLHQMNRDKASQKYDEIQAENNIFGGDGQSLITPNQEDNQEE